MAAGLGFKDFTTGEVLTAADVDGYLMQGVWVFASAAARTSAVASPQEGNMSFLKDTNSLEYYDGAAWTAVAGGGGTTFVGCKVTSAAQTIPNNTSTLLTFTTETFDTDSFHNNSTNTSRITIPTGKGGYYLVLGTGYWTTNATGTARYLELLKNGSLQFYNNADTTGSTEPSNFISQIVNVVATDYLELRVVHTRGADLNYNDIQFQVSYLGA
jgi:hypothetical protein